jgi:protein gp37
MAKHSKIEWTDHTWNPWIGCTKVSTGCKNCYAETWANRYPRWRDTWGAQGTRIKTSKANWRKPLDWNRQAEKESRRFRVFCGSLCDVFEGHWSIGEHWHDVLFTVIETTPSLDWLLLTKRPENVNEIWPHNSVDLWRWSPDNVWIGTSVENQEQADKRIPELLKIQAAVRFLSCEPLLGPVDLTIALGGEDGTGFGGYGIRSAVDWVIVGGESGPNKRPMDLVWARDIRDQCQAADVPFFFKQVDKVQEIPDDLMIREFPNE